MDGVLVRTRSSWTSVHKVFKVDERTTFERYLRGEFDYLEFLRRDIGFWGHVHVNRIRKILDQVPIMPGAEDTFRILHKNGYVTAIISSGINILAEKLKKKAKRSPHSERNLLKRKRTSKRSLLNVMSTSRKVTRPLNILPRQKNPISRKSTWAVVLI